MPQWIPLLLLALNLPVFHWLHGRYFPQVELWQRALAFEHSPELTPMILSQDWRGVFEEIRLARWAGACGLVLSVQYALLQLWFVLGAR
ncbi:MAG: hypothetical protein ACO1RX_05855 [Candidatus Sericytochromatia bacterium]